ncbi:PTS fructose transporter subunit IIA [Escherichia coli]|uniref:PTS fructose transporter subunit IIA n=1 Tax=Escherichia coli TaxID=562 RepID=UPI0037DD8BD1
MPPSAGTSASCIDLNIQGNGAYSVLKQLATIALQNGFITDSHQFLQTLLLREKMHSTGFGSGVAVPHGKSACVKQPFVLFARKAQAIDWKASDGEDVNCWICLGVPQSGEEDQVKIIGTLCRKIIHKEFIHQLQQGDTDQVLALLNQTLSS